MSIDTSCIKVKGNDSDLNAIENWINKGLLHRERADTLLKDLDNADPKKGLDSFSLAQIAKGKTIALHPPKFVLDESYLDSLDDNLTGPYMWGEIQKVLFPDKNILDL